MQTACDAMQAHGRHRTRAVKRVARVHLDPFEPILPVLEGKSPVGKYRKITEEIIRRMPDQRRYPKAAAEAVCSLLILRFGLHTGLRQRTCVNCCSVHADACRPQSGFSRSAGAANFAGAPKTMAGKC